jgi:hypothetical protein
MELTGQRNGKLKTGGAKVFRDPAESDAQEAPGGSAQARFKMRADAATTKFERELTVGTPHAKNLSGGIEFENEFVEPANDGGPGTLLQAGDGA